MRTKEIEADTIDEAAEKILDELKEKTNVFYFDGWDGLGASAVLRAIATPTSPAGKRALVEFDQVIHIDCSMWVSRRVLQRVVAEQLKLPDQVMELFDKQDEEDDFRGVAEGYRAEVQRVVEEMYQQIQKLNCRFLVIFHNGSSDEIDLASLCGFPLFGVSTNKVLWTFQGRFRLKPRAKVDMAMKSIGTTNRFLSATSHHKEKDPQELWPYLVEQEALEVVGICKDLPEPAQVVECFLYIMELCCRGSPSIDYDLATHSANYWACDGIIQQGERDNDGADDGFWGAADALQREMRLDVDYRYSSPSTHLAKFVESKPYWSSPTFGFTRVPAGVISNGDMFQHFLDKLAVLKLSRCTFAFRSPPFCHCHSLRFLWLDHCKDTGVISTDRAAEENIRRCFQRLWVFAVCHTDCDQILSAQMMDLMAQLRELNVIGAEEWDMGQLHGRLPNIRKLRITKSTILCSYSEDDLFSEMNKMELLDFSGNDTDVFSPKKLSGLISNSNSCLESVTVNRYEGDLRRMSFWGCTKLKDLFLGGTISTDTLDISGTLVKTLDLSAITGWRINEIRLLACYKLCAILWPSFIGVQDDECKLLIDTTQSVSSSARFGKEECQGGSTAATPTAAATHHELGNRQPIGEFGWDISVRDARLLFSLESVYHPSREAYVEVSSPAHPTVTAWDVKTEAIKSGSKNKQRAPEVYKDTTVVVHNLQQAIEGEGDAPDLPSLSELRCYMHIQDLIWSTKAPGSREESSAITVPKFVIGSAKILHVHDSLSITAIPSATPGWEWAGLQWCRIRRCPKLECVFTDAQRKYTGLTYELRTFWASQLLKARYICKWNEERSDFWRSFPYLTLLHLDYCPRLIHVLPVYKVNGYLPGLETIEIVWCGDLREVFPFYADRSLSVGFPNLKRIHLHELPSLQHICGLRMSAPNLETVKIRGCWSLTRLPDISGSNNVVECDCEKEWWDRLEWDNSSQESQSRYKPIHSRYYKKTLLRGSVLR